MTYLALSVTRVMHRVRIETFKLVWREEDAPLVAFYLCKEVLLLVVMCRCNVACGRRLRVLKCNYKLSRSNTYQTTVTEARSLTLHANEQQVGCQLSPVPLGLLFVDPVPVKTEKVDDNLFTHRVIQGLLQIYPLNRET